MSHCVKCFRTLKSEREMMTSSNGIQSRKVATWLRELYELEASAGHSKGKPAPTSATARVNSLRELIPTSILRHYDHLKARGKRSVAAVRRGVCGSCHLAFPSGSLASLRRTNETLKVCINCGAFVYLAEEEPANGSANAVADIRKRGPSRRAVAPVRPRTRARKAHAAI
jgi:predicted  nucleic acid-binding Zn-ribbon protein